MSTVAKHCGRCGSELSTSTPGLLGFCMDCLRAILFDWQRRQCEPIDLELADIDDS